MKTASPKWQRHRCFQRVLQIAEIPKESPDLSIFLDFPAKLMGKKRHSRDKYKLLEEFWGIQSF